MPASSLQVAVGWIPYLPLEFVSFDGESASKKREPLFPFFSHLTFIPYARIHPPTHTLVPEIPSTRSAATRVDCLETATPHSLVGESICFGLLCLSYTFLT